MSMKSNPVDVRLSCGESKTKQSPRDLTDVNSIMRRAFRGQGVDHVTTAAPVFADVSRMGDFQDVCIRVKAAESAFQALPAKIRARFRNRPAELVAFVQDSANYDEAVELGLIVPKVVKEEVPPMPKPKAKAKAKVEPEPDPEA